MRHPASAASAIALLALVAACSAGAGRGGGGGADGGDNGGDGGFVLDTGGDGGISFEAGASDGEPGGCAVIESAGTRVPATLLVVFDRSGSMRDGDKWTAAVPAINGALASADDALPVGLLVFPLGKFDSSKMLFCLLNAASDPACPALLADSGCKDIATVPDVPIAPLSTSRAQVATFLASATPDGNNTPTRWALRNAWTILQNAKVGGDRYVVLVTDGEPTTHTPAVAGFPDQGVECGDEATIEAETKAAASAATSVKTFAIGVPGSEKGAVFLSTVAVNGGTAAAGCDPATGKCHYQVGATGFGDALKAALTEIAGKVRSCTFDLPTGPDTDPNAVNIEVDDGTTKTPLFRDPGHKDGWDYVDGTKTQVEIFGAECDAVKSSSAATVRVAVGCKTRIR